MQKLIESKLNNHFRFSDYPLWISFLIMVLSNFLNIARAEDTNLERLEQIYIQLNEISKIDAKIPGELQLYVAKTAEPNIVKIPQNITVKEVIKRTCGLDDDLVTEFYINKIKELNVDLNFDGEKIDREIKAPACIPPINPKTIIVQRNENPTSIVKNNLSYNSEADVHKLANKFVDLNGIRNPKKDIKPDDELTLPGIYSGVYVTIDPDKTTSKDFNKKIKGGLIDEGIDATFENSNRNQSFKIVKPVSDNEIDADCKASIELAQNKGDSYPFNELLTSIILNRSFTKANDHNIDLRPQIVGIIDTGLRGINQIFDEAWFYKANIPEDRDVKKVSPCKIIYYGTNPIEDKNSGFCVYNQNNDYDTKWHGTHVTDLVSGGKSFRSIAIKEPSAYLRLQIFRVVQSEMDSITSLPKFIIDKEGITNSNKFINDRDVKIANISLSTTGEISEFKSFYRPNSRTLVVVAAGNDHSDLGLSALYPASYGGMEGALKDNFITVAAHNGKKEKPNFSNFSKKYVDIAAPGCVLNAQAPDGPKNEITTKPVSGTSYAAPLVTFTVAIIRTLGIDNPKDIKNRLYAGSDYSSYWGSLVSSSGTLNIPKSIAIFDDVLETKTSSSMFILGEWENSNVNIDLCEDGPSPYERKNILKITPITNNSSDKIKLRIVSRDAHNNLEIRECNPKNPTTKFINQEIYNPNKLNYEKHVGSSDDINWTDIKDIVPKTNF